MAANLGWECLPTDPLLHIFSYLGDFKDLVRCSQVCQRYNEICSEESLWKKLCFEYWNLNRCLPGFSWKATFEDQYGSFGRYKNYKKLKVAWQKLHQYLQDNCPDIASKIKEGATEEMLDEVERRKGRKLPNDIRCSFRIANGQKLRNHGIFGSMKISNHYCSECLLDCHGAPQEIADEDETPVEWWQNCLQLTISSGVKSGQCLVWKRYQRPDEGKVLCPVNNHVDGTSEQVDFFITGNDFLSWFINEVDLVTNEYPIIDGVPYKFIHNKESVAMTGPIKVSAATCFLPEHSTIRPPYFIHTYRITMSMDENASADWSCQLETRHWIITDETGHEETVDGPGVVGKYPTMRPGVSFSWISCTTFATTHGSMKGHFVMRNLKSGERLDVECPTFHMKCLPYITRDDDIY